MVSPIDGSMTRGADFVDAAGALGAEVVVTVVEAASETVTPCGFANMAARARADSESLMTQVLSVPLYLAPRSFSTGRLLNVSPKNTI